MIAWLQALGVGEVERAVGGDFPRRGGQGKRVHQEHKMVSNNGRVVEFGWYLPPETQPMKRAQGVRISVKLSDGRVYNKNIP
jgi:hypothetical protein